LAAFLLADLDVLFLDGVVIDLADNRHLARLADLTSRSTRDVDKRRHRALNSSFGRQIVNGPGRFSELSDPRDLVTTQRDSPRLQPPPAPSRSPGHRGTGRPTPRVEEHEPA